MKNVLNKVHEKLVIIVKNESILNTVSSSLPLNYLHESHDVSQDSFGIDHVLKEWYFCLEIVDLKTLSRIFWKFGKMRFSFKTWIIGNLVCVKTCYSFKNVKSFPMTTNQFLIDDLWAFWSRKQNHLESNYISLSHNLFFWQIWCKTLEFMKLDMISKIKV